MKNSQQFRYVQIAGNHKSGTSLLSSLLDHHPDIACYPGQSSFTGYLYPFLSDPGVSLQKKFALVHDERFKKETDGYIPLEACNFFEVEQRFQTLAQENPNHFAALHFALLQAFYDVFDPSRMESSRVWLDKSPLSHLFADEIFAAFPLAKYIHLLRDPKDNFASVGGSFLKENHSRVKSEALLWRYRIWSAQSFYFAHRNQQKFGKDRYMIMRFQDLCTAPLQIMPEIAAFIGVPELPMLYQPTRAGYFYPGNNKEGTVFTGISADNVGRWMERIPPYYAQVMESQPAEYLRAFDFQPHFSEYQRAKALRTHRLITALTPRATRYIKFHRRHFQRPAENVPGV